MPEKMPRSSRTTFHLYHTLRRCYYRYHENFIYLETGFREAKAEFELFLGAAKMRSSSTTLYYAIKYLTSVI